MSNFLRNDSAAITPMKTLVLSSLFACGIALAALAGMRGPASTDLTIVSASYGVGNQHVDVTPAARSLVSHELILLRAPWALGARDPAPGQVKQVSIVYRLNGVQGTATFGQHQDIILPPKAHGLVIASASFGLPGRRVDVTDALRSRMRNGALAVPADWFLGQVDPAHGSKKTVEIIYLQDGTPGTATFSEEEDIILPKTTP
jgi:hypothetical protein